MILGYSTDPWEYQPWGWRRRDVPIEASADDYTSGLPKPVTIVSGMSDEAQRLFYQWKSKSDDSGRLRYNLMKVALLTASANGDEIVTAEGMQAAIEFMGWQERLLEVFVPGISVTLEGRFAEAALAAFRRRGGEKKPVSWKRIAHDLKWSSKYGTRVVTQGIKGLLESGEIYPEETVEETADGKQKHKKSTHRIFVRVFKEKS